MNHLAMYQQLYNKVFSQTHTLQDLLDNRCKVMVEGDSGRDIVNARKLGLFTCNVKGVDIIAKCESDAAPLIHYIEQGGTYGSLDFSRLLGYAEQQIKEYAELIKLQSQLKIPNFSPNAGLSGFLDEKISKTIVITTGIVFLLGGFFLMKSIVSEK